MAANTTKVRKKGGFKLVKNKGFRYQWDIRGHNFVKQTNEYEITEKTETFRPTIEHRMS